MQDDAAPRRGSEVWRRFGDIRGLGLTAHVLAMQIAHPVVGAGVVDHSDYRSDPYGRFNRTYLSITTVVYGGPTRSAAEAERLRMLHRRIRGTDEHGRKYHALDPGAYAWVHLTLVKAVADAHAMFGRPMTRTELAVYYAENIRLGRLLAVRAQDMPPTWPEFLDYYDDMVEHTLENTRALREFLDTLRRPAKPKALRRLPDERWRQLTGPTARITYLTTVAALPETLRKRCDLHLTPEERREVERFARRVRTATGLIPAPARRAPAVLVPRIHPLLPGQRTRADASGRSTIGSR
ncbi:oxygenase MpaB family protein [Yinghuangia sp. YIM S09857]|uniref:oxygenase MpaB family protein n=1 Tax=Yinghuangia sp. YIM S09857 TaxID=3436929 RepID=UPI003F532329